MTKYKVTFGQLVPVTRSAFVVDDLDELDAEEIAYEAELSIRDYLEANGIGYEDLEDPEIERLD